MEPSKRERIFLFGVVPVLAAVLGSLVTVLVGYWTGGHANPDATMIEILRTPGLTPEQKAELMKLANASTDRFYSWLTSVGLIVVLALGALGPSIAERIRRG